MAASLYDDLDVLDGTPLSATETNTTSSVPLVGLRVAANWNTSESESLDVYGTGIANTNAATSMKFMQSHMAAKRAQGRRDNFSARPSIAPVVDLKQRNNAEGSFRFNHQTGRLERVGSRGVLGSSPAIMTGGLLFGEPALPLGVTDEYNPLMPNDFEELVRIKRERRRAEEAAIAAAAHRHEGGDLSGMCKRPDFSDYEDDDDEFDEPTAASGGRHGRQSAPPPKGAAIAPPSSLLEGTTVDPGSTSEGPMETEESETVGATTKFGINAVAAKMMARMGYREGQGLGRESQGMATALVVEKTSRRGGKIIHERDQQRQQATQQNPLPDSTVEETINNLPLPENRSCVCSVLRVHYVVVLIHSGYVTLSLTCSQEKPSCLLVLLSGDFSLLFLCVITTECFAFSRLSPSSSSHTYITCNRRPSVFGYGSGLISLLLPALPSIVFASWEPFECLLSLTFPCVVHLVSAISV